MPERMARANAAKSAIRARVEHVFAHQENRYGLFIRTIGIARAQAKLTLANFAYNFDRLILSQPPTERQVSIGIGQGPGSSRNPSAEPLGSSKSKHAQNRNGSRKIFRPKDVSDPSN